MPQSRATTTEETPFQSVSWGGSVFPPENHHLLDAGGALAFVLRFIFARWP